MKAKFNFTVTGLIIAMMVLSIVVVGLMSFLSELTVEYNIEENSSLSYYNSTQKLIDRAEKIRNATLPKGDQNIFQDLFGFASAGYNSLFIAGDSLEVFEGLSSQAAEDVPGYSTFAGLIIAIIIIGLIVGVIVAALVKWRT